MNSRQRNKYIMRDVPCAHQERYIDAYIGDIAIICKASKNSSDYCDGRCKKYKPKFPIKYSK